MYFGEAARNWFDRFRNPQPNQPQAPSIPSPTDGSIASGVAPATPALQPQAPSDPGAYQPPWMAARQKMQDWFKSQPQMMDAWKNFRSKMGSRMRGRWGFGARQKPQLAAPQVGAVAPAPSPLVTQ